ncbi:MAG: pentapeptide repeat-containing protein [archaeon]
MENPIVPVPSNTTEFVQFLAREGIYGRIDDVQRGDIKNKISVINGENFQGFKLINADLSNLTFKYCNFTRTNLTNANLNNSNFYGCDFKDAILNNIKKSGTRFDKCNLKGTILENK